MTAYEQIQQMLASREDTSVPLHQVLITEQLQQRPSRPPDYNAENTGLAALAQELATNPSNVLQKLCELALELCGAHSAGVSIEEELDGEKIFRWRAVAGEMSGYLHGILPRGFAPCAIVVDENAPQLFDRPVLHYPYVKEIEPFIYEVLLIPFRVADKPVGTVWVVSSKETRHFDREDERVLTHLSQFAAASFYLVESREAVQDANRQLTGELAQQQASLQPLESERAHLAELLTRTPAFIAVLRGPNHVFERANPPYMRLVGQRDIIGRPVSEALPEVQNQGFIELLDHVYQTGETFVGKEVGIHLQSPEGTGLEERFLDFVYQPLSEADGSVSGIFVHGVDLTERTEALVGIRKSEAHLRSILESSADCIKVMDHRGHLLEMNTPGQCLMEIDNFSAVHGREWVSFWQGEDRERAKAALAQALTIGRAHFQGYCATAKGTLKWWDVVLTAIPTSADDEAMLLGVSRDLTELREHAQILEAKNQEIETLNQRLQQSMTETHHRVKNNLQLISTLIEMQHGAEGDMVPMSEFMRLGSSVRALGVIHDVLTQNSKSNPQDTTISAQTVLEKLLTMLQHTLGHNHHFTFTIDDARLPSRKVTALALLTNELFSNALKHGNGSVQIAFRVDEETARLEVRDNGAGFAPDFSASLYANTGLTLIETVARHDLNGDVFYENLPEGGAQVIVRIPLS